MDPDLPGGRDCLILRLLDDTPQVGDRETIEKYWGVPETRVKLQLDGIQKADEEIEVLMEDLQRNIIQREATRNTLKVEILKGVVFKKMKVIEGLENKIKDLMVEVAEEKVLRMKAEDDDKSRTAFLIEAKTRKADDNEDKLTIELLQNRLAEKDLEIKSISWKDFERVHNLSEETEMAEFTQRARADQIGDYTDRLVEVSKGLKAELMNLAKGGQNEDWDHSIKLKNKPESEPEKVGDIIQTEMDLEKEQVESKRSRDGVQNEASKDLVKPQGNMETACSIHEGKKQRVT